MAANLYMAEASANANGERSAGCDGEELETLEVTPPVIAREMDLDRIRHAPSGRS